MSRYFYDLTYSPDDAKNDIHDRGWYAEVFAADCCEKVVYETPLFATRDEAIADIHKRYPQAELLKEFT